MKRLSVLVCTMSGRLPALRPEQYPATAGVVYVFSCQYPATGPAPQAPRWLQERPDASFYPLAGRGLSANRNLAMEKATADLVMFADDDTRFCEHSFDYIFRLFALA